MWPMYIMFLVNYTLKNITFNYYYFMAKSNKNIYPLNFFVSHRL